MKIHAFLITDGKFYPVTEIVKSMMVQWNEECGKVFFQWRNKESREIAISALAAEMEMDHIITNDITELMQAVNGYEISQTI